MWWRQKRMPSWLARLDESRSAMVFIHCIWGFPSLGGTPIRRPWDDIWWSQDVWDWIGNMIIPIWLSHYTWLYMIFPTLFLLFLLVAQWWLPSQVILCAAVGEGRSYQICRVLQCQIQGPCGQLQLPVCELSLSHMWWTLKTVQTVF